MANYDEIYGGSKYLTAAEVGHNVLRMKIGSVEPVDLRQQDGTTRKKLVLYFNGADKGLVLNKTNAGILAAAFGKNTNAWLDQGVEIGTAMTGLGKLGLSVRVLRVNKPIQDDMADEIPFD